MTPPRRQKRANELANRATHDTVQAERIKLESFIYCVSGDSRVLCGAYRQSPQSGAGSVCGGRNVDAPSYVMPAANGAVANCALNK
jgi:hypothetical protein